MGAFSRTWAVVVYEFLWDVRKWRTYVVLPLVLLLTLVVGLGPRVFTGGVSEDRSVWWETTIAFINTGFISGLLPLLVGGFLSSDSLATEFDKGTIGALFSQPIRRGEVYLGKLLEKGILLIGMSAAMVGLAIGASEVSVGPQARLIWAVVFVLSMMLVFLAFAALAFFLGSVIPSGTVVLGAMIGLFFGLLLGPALAFLHYGFGVWLYFVPVINGVDLVPALQAYIANPHGTTVVAVNLGGLAGRSATVATAANLELSLVGAVVESAMLFGLGYLLFRRAEVKG